MAQHTATQFHSMPINHDWPQAIRDWHFVATKAAEARDETAEARFLHSTRTREAYAAMSEMAQDGRQRRLDRMDAIEYAQWQALAAIDALGAEMLAEWEQEQAEQAESVAPAAPIQPAEVWKPADIIRRINA